MAAQYGHLEAVQLLLAAGADPNIKNSREETALDHAAQYGRRDTVTLLLETHPEMVGKVEQANMIYYTSSNKSLDSFTENTVVKGMTFSIITSYFSTRRTAACSTPTPRCTWPAGTGTAR